MNFGFVIDNRNCIGCHACTVACKAEHDVPIGVNRTWVKYVEKGQFPNTRRVFSVMRCNHCEDSPCTTICPTSALFTRPDGIVDFNNERCIACKSCTQACPYDAIYIDPETLTAAKCNYCAHRVDVGLEPACVNVCPTEAIVSGDLDDPISKISKLVAGEQVTVRKPEKGTIPNLFYIEGDHASLLPLETQHSERYLWNSQASGVGHHSGHNGGYSFVYETKKTSNPPKVSKTDEGSKQTSRRVYDAPHRGILWGWEVAGYIFTKAISAGILAFPMLFQLTDLGNVSDTVLLTTSIMSLLFLGLTGVLLIMDLDQPMRFLYVLLRPHWSSWLVKGGYTITVFGGLVTLFCVLKYFELAYLADLLIWPILILSVLLAVYTAFLFGQAKGRDFWQSPLLSIHMLLHSVVGGSAALLFMSLFWTDMKQLMPLLNQVLIWSLVVQLFSFAVEFLSSHPTEDGVKAARMITHGNFSKTFWVGVVFFGNGVPILLISVNPGFLAIAVATFLVLIGVWLSIRIWVMAPQMVALS